MSILLTILGLALLILLHEFGHFICAKIFHIGVDEFGIGFPPRLFGKKFGETIYSINILPLGGFVRLRGEATSAEALADQKSFVAAPAWKRAVVVVAGVAMNILAGWVIIATVLFVGTPNSVVVEEVKLNTPAAHAGLRVGDMIDDFQTAKQFTEFIKAHQGKIITLAFHRAGELIGVPIKLSDVADSQKGVLGVAVADGGI